MIMVRKTTLCSTLLAAGLLVAAGASPAMAAESRVATDQLTANQTVTISDIPEGHQAGTLTLYRIADYTAASVDGTELKSYDVHATATSNISGLKPSLNDKDPSKPDSSASADEQLAYVLQHYKSANNKADNYGLYSELLRDSVGSITGIGDMPSYPVTFAGTTASVQVPAGVYVMTDTAESGVQCQASLFATGVGGATTIGDTVLNQTVCKHVIPDAPVIKVLDEDGSAQSLTHISTGDIVSWQVSAKAGWEPYVLLHTMIPNGFEYVATTNVTFSESGAMDKSKFETNTDDFRSEQTDKGREFVVQLRPHADTHYYRSGYGSEKKDVFVKPSETVTVTFTTRVTDKNRVVIDGDGNTASVERFWIQNENQYGEGTAQYKDTCLYATNARGEQSGVLPTAPLYAKCGVIAGNTATVKTHEITLKKTDMAGKSLNGARFVLSRVGRGLMVDDSKYVSGYGTPADLTVDGSLTLKGLDTGDYVLTETTAPAGYNTTALPSVTFTMNEDGTITEKSGDLFELVSADNNTVTVKNAKNLTQLPLTGAGGVILASVVALMLIAAGVAIEARRRA